MMLDDGYDANALPLRGVVVCSTSLPQELRTLLNELSEQMGAIHRLDLTADVTHLIVGSIDTPKYKHTAKERPDIDVLKPEWIHAIRQAWRDGQDLDLEALTQEYRLPAFYNLNICVTGFEDIDQRQELIQVIGSNGASYRGDLTRDVTHLIVAKAKGAKYDRAKSWNTVKIVSLKWLQESLERGMTLDESPYHPLMPAEDQGLGAFVRGFKRMQMLGKRQREDTTALSKEEAGKRKLRRTASTRLAGHSQNLLADMSFTEGEDTSAVNNDQWTESRGDMSEPVPSRKGTPLSGIDISHPVSRAPTPPNQQARGLFSDLLCYPHGFDARRDAKVIEITSTNNGDLAQSIEDLSLALEDKSHEHAVLLLPSEWTSLTKQTVPVVPEGVWIVTELWLERCIQQKRVINPAEDVLCRTNLQLPIDGFQNMSVSTSGMGQDILHISKIVKIAGARYDEELTQRTSILVVPNLTAKPEKLTYAAKHKIPVVSPKWLFESISQARKLPVTDYVVSNSSKPLFSNESLGRPQSREASHALTRDTRKDDPRAQRLSAIRKRNVAPSLPLVKSHSVRLPSETKTKVTREGPFIEEDVTSDTEQSSAPKRLQNVYDAHAQKDVVVIDETVVEGLPADLPPPYALQDLPPEMNTSRRQARGSQSIEGNTRSISPVKPAETPDVGGHREQGSDQDGSSVPKMENSRANNTRLEGDIKSLLERKHSANAPVEPQAKGRWRKDRKLGRATSMTSNSSTGVSFRQSTSLDLDTALPSRLEELVVPMPSQQLSYETPDAQEYQAKLSKRMGTILRDDSLGTRVESPGMVRDTDTSSGSGVGSRVRGRNRAVKN